MKTIYSEQGFRYPACLWLPKDEIEPGAFEQIRNASAHPDLAAPLAVMPDCHVGYGLTIGSVFATANSVVPNAVGVDIGCGMAALPTGVRFDESMDRTFWKAWAAQVKRDVPVGFSWHKEAQSWSGLDFDLYARELQHLIEDKAAVQLGTLGGGNHFLEAQTDERGFIWFMVHSGSRRTGLDIANHYHKRAVERWEKHGGGVKDLAALSLDDEAGNDYLHDMQWAKWFAVASRTRMVRAMLAAFDRFDAARIDQAIVLDMIDTPHNFARLEALADGQTVMLHRKGATSAKKGELGIIPGSMGSPSFIVRGLGNPDSYQSCSHGVGRRMGRGAAKRAITEDAFAASLVGTFSEPSMSYVDEAPGAYKDVGLVISRQLDLIEIVHTLNPIITVKGDTKARED